MRRELLKKKNKLYGILLIVAGLITEEKGESKNEEKRSDFDL